jgi:hypothetical protein
VDHLREDFPPSTPIQQDQMEAFQATVQDLSAAIAKLVPATK